MTEVQVYRETEVYQDYRSNRVRSLFNVEDERGSTFELEATLPDFVGEDWNIGLIVGPSGSGKSSIGWELTKQPGVRWWAPRWPRGKPIIEAIGKKHDFDTVTGALASVGLGDVPAWLRPYDVLSMGEQFRANLARLCVEGGEGAWVVDEFTSVVDRQIARIGSMAFAKTFRRSGGKAVLLSCHHDIVEWLVPDWCYDTGTGELWYPKAQGSNGPPSTLRSGKSAGPTGTCLSRITI